MPPRPKTLHLPSIRWLMVGTLTAQIIKFAATPLLTFYYAPDAFGIFAAVFAMAVIAASILSLRLEILVPFCRKQSEIIAFAQLTFLLPLLAVAALSIPFFYSTAPHFASYLLPLAIIATAGLAAMRSVSIRSKIFKHIAIGSVLQSLCFVLLALALAIFGINAGASGLLLSQIIASIAFAAYLLLCIAPRIRARLARLSCPKIKAAITNHKPMIQALSLTQILAVISQNLPFVILALSYDAAAAGYYAIAVRIAQEPTNLLATSINTVFRQRAAEIWRGGGRFHGLILRGASVIFLLTLLPFVIASYSADTWLGLLLGDAWNNASFSVSVMLLYAVIACSVKSFDQVAIILGSRLFIYIWDYLSFLLVLALGLAAYLGYLDYRSWLVLSLLLRGVMMLILLFGTYYLARYTPHAG